MTELMGAEFENLLLDEATKVHSIVDIEFGVSRKRYAKL
jgi:hypothetical protein